MVPEDFIFAYKGWQQKKEQEYKNHWEMTREIAYSTAIAPYLDMKKYGGKFTKFDLMKFPWDKGFSTKKIKPPSRKYMDKLFAKEKAEFIKS